MAMDKQHHASRSRSADISFCTSKSCANKSCARNTRGNLYKTASKSNPVQAFADFESLCLDYLKED